MFIIGTDIGGTFTDCAVVDETGDIVAFAKHPSTPSEPAEGVLGVLDVVAEQLSRSRRELLAETSLFMHGTTIATNAMIERKGVPTGLLITMGHEDTLHIGRVFQKVAGLSEAEIIHESRLHKAEPPVVERRNTRGVAERLGPDGEVVVPLQEEQVVAAAQALVDNGVQAIAVSLLYAFRNSAHEVRVAELLTQHWPEIFVATSHAIAPLQGEYERTATTALTCYLGPQVARYVTRLAERLQAEGFGRQLFLMQAGGGVTTPAEVRSKPLQLLDSGPVGGTLGSRFFAARYGEPNVICTDMGGTSFDVSILANGELQKDEQGIIAQYVVLQQKVDIATIGSGGGSLIQVDADGLLHVGPESAGAVPGPACYGTGGQRPTVTDADLVLGYLNPDYFLGGRIRLDAERARAAFAPVAERLGTSIEDAALGAVRVVNAQMADAIRRDTIEKGLDPRQFVLFSYGGAGSAHAAFFGRDLRVRSVFIPHHATVFSALGMTTADVLHTAERSLGLRLPLAPEGIARINSVLDGIGQQLRQQFTEGGLDPRQARLDRFVYVKYGLQVHQIPVRVPDRALTGADEGQIKQDFEQAYEHLYGRGTGYARAGLELVKCRVTGTLTVSAPAPREQTAERLSDWAGAQKAERHAYFTPGQGPIMVPILDGERLQPGHALPGPVIVERPGDTVVIPPDMEAYVDRFLNIRMDLV